MRLGTSARWFGELLGRRCFWWGRSGSQKGGIGGRGGIAIRCWGGICFFAGGGVVGGCGRCWGGRWGRVCGIFCIRAGGGVARMSFGKSGE